MGKEDRMAQLRLIWDQIEPIKGSRRPFLCFFDLRYHLNEKGV